MCSLQGRDYAQRVGRKKPNRWGLYDMYGNVIEWCADWHADSYTQTATRDPRGPTSGRERVSRGGGWTGLPESYRSAARDSGYPDENDNGETGFRVVVEDGE